MSNLSPRSQKLINMRVQGRQGSGDDLAQEILGKRYPKVNLGKSVKSSSMDEFSKLFDNFTSEFKQFQKSPASPSGKPAEIEKQSGKRVSSVFGDDFSSALRDFDDVWCEFSGRREAPPSPDLSPEPRVNSAALEARSRTSVDLMAAFDDFDSVWEQMRDRTFTEEAQSQLEQMKERLQSSWLEVGSKEGVTEQSVFRRRNESIREPPAGFREPDQKPLDRLRDTCASCTYSRDVTVGGPLPARDSAMFSGICQRRRFPRSRHFNKRWTWSSFDVCREESSSDGEEETALESVRTRSSHPVDDKVTQAETGQCKCHLQGFCPVHKVTNTHRYQHACPPRLTPCLDTLTYNHRDDDAAIYRENQSWEYNRTLSDPVLGHNEDVPRYLCDSRSDTDGSRCSDCDYTCHHQCRELANVDCPNPTYSSRGQGSRSSETSLSDSQDLPVKLRTDDTDSGYCTGESIKKTIRSEIRTQIRPFNLDVSPSTTGSASVPPADGSAYQGFVRVHMNLSRPINMAIGARPPSIYEAMSHTAESSEEDVITSFYLPKDTIRAIHIDSDTTSHEVIEMLLRKFKITDNPRKFALFEQTIENDNEFKMKKLGETEKPLQFCVKWSSDSLKKKRFMLQENDTGEILWDEFSLPELLNFLRILDKEEKDYETEIRQKYKLHKIQMQEQLKEIERNRSPQSVA